MDTKSVIKASLFFSLKMKKVTLIDTGLTAARKYLYCYELAL